MALCGFSFSFPDGIPLSFFSFLLHRHLPHQTSPSVNVGKRAKGWGKNVVIVGGGIAGALLAKLIQNHAQVTLIDPKEFFDITWAGLRSMVDPSFAERQLIDYNEFLPEVKLVISWATNITETEVLTAHGDQIPYDYLVVATGHVRSESDPVTRDESLLYYKEEYDKIKSSNSVLIIGGGPTGVEFAAEVADHFPDKKITLVHRGSRLLEFIGSKASQKAMDWLSSKKIDVILGQSVNLKPDEEGVYEISNGDTIVAEYFFDSTGRPIGTSWLQNTILKGSLDIQCRVAVDKNLLVKGHKSIFAIGDLTNLPELKQGFAAMRHAQIVAKNLKSLLGGGSVEKLSSYKPGRPMAFVSLGRKEALAQVSCFTMSGILPGMYKSGDLFVGTTRKTYGLRPGDDGSSCCSL